MGAPHHNAAPDWEPVFAGFTATGREEMRRMMVGAEDSSDTATLEEMGARACRGLSKP